MPYPNSLLRPGPAIRSEVDCSRHAMSEFFRLGCAAHTRAAVALTMGAAKLVPFQYWWPFTRVAPSTRLPGAAMSTYGPTWDSSTRVPSWLTPATPRTPGWRAGEGGGSLGIALRAEPIGGGVASAAVVWWLPTAAMTR